MTSPRRAKVKRTTRISKAKTRAPDSVSMQVAPKKAGPGPSDRARVRASANASFKRTTSPSAKAPGQIKKTSPAMSIPKGETMIPIGSMPPKPTGRTDPTSQIGRQPGSTSFTGTITQVKGTLPPKASGTSSMSKIGTQKGAVATGNRIGKSPSPAGDKMLGAVSDAAHRLGVTKKPKAGA